MRRVDGAKVTCLTPGDLRVRREASAVVRRYEGCAEVSRGRISRPRTAVKGRT